MLKQFRKIFTNWYSVITVVPLVSVLIISTRNAGFLQPLEFSNLDLYFQLRPLEAKDKSVVIVGVTERDIENLRGWPTSDWVLAKVLSKVKSQHPRVIGLNLYRNKHVEPGGEKLANLYKSTPNLIGVQKVIADKFSPAIPPPPLLKQLNQVSSNDLVVDPDGTVRRAVLFPIPGKDIQSLGLAVSLVYLNNQGIKPETDQNGFLKLGNRTFPPFEANDGGYVNTDAGGYQTLLNFRNPTHSFTRVSFTDVLKDRISPDLMRERIVLIGAVAGSLNDTFFTPYSRNFNSSPIRTSGIEIHANIASQIIRWALNGRPLIKVWNETLENLWFVFWSGFITIIIWRWRYSQLGGKFSIRFLLKALTSCTLATICLVSITYVAFLQGLWIPVAPALIALVSSTVTIVGYVYVFQLQKAYNDLSLLNNKLLVTLKILHQAESYHEEQARWLKNKQ